MTEPAVGAGSTESPEPKTAGALLRQARQAKGLHIAALAAAIKVSPHKLELLESDRFDELPGTTFIRALAQTVCRTLKIDAAPVLALLPVVPGHGLDRMSAGLNEPFRDRPGRIVPTDLGFMKHPMVLGTIGLVILALAAWFVPNSWVVNPDVSEAPAAQMGEPVPDPVPGLDLRTSDSLSPSPAESTGEAVTRTLQPAASSDAAASAATAALAGSSGAQDAERSAAAAVPPAPTPSAVASDAPTPGTLQLSVSAESWVEVLDRNGRSLLSRRLQSGETVGVDGAGPLKVVVGNAAATRISYKGKPVDLTPVTSRGNVARLELN